MNECNYVECSNLTATKYCSFSCGLRQRHLNNPRPRKYKNCEFCNKEFRIFARNSMNRFCNRSCSATFNNLERGKKNPCIQCGSPKGTYASSFCSHTCQQEFQQADRVARWLSGELEITTYSAPRWLRRHLLEKAEYRCQDGRSGCNGWGMVNPKSNKTCLQVDHINGLWYDYSVGNLVILCPNCHSMTPTYGALNLGKGRKHRKNLKDYV